MHMSMNPEAWQKLFAGSKAQIAFMAKLFFIGPGSKRDVAWQPGIALPGKQEVLIVIRRIACANALKKIPGECMEKSSLFFRPDCNCSRIQ